LTPPGAPTSAVRPSAEIATAVPTAVPFVGQSVSEAAGVVAVAQPPGAALDATAPGPKRPWIASASPAGKPERGVAAEAAESAKDGEALPQSSIRNAARKTHAKPRTSRGLTGSDPRSKQQTERNAFHK
jgi:hypothetical protein